MAVDIKSTFNWDIDYLEMQLSTVREELRRKQAEFEDLLNELDRLATTCKPVSKP